MYPVLLRFGPLTIHTYGFLLAVGFLIGMGVALMQAKKEGIPSNKILDLGFYILLAAIIGSRLFFILINLGHYIQNPLDVFKIWEGGLVFYGGVILAVPTVIWYVKKNSLDIWILRIYSHPQLLLDMLLEGSVVLQQAAAMEKLLNLCRGASYLQTRKTLLQQIYYSIRLNSMSLPVSSLIFCCLSDQKE